MLSDMTKGPWHVVAYGDGDSLVICEDEAGEKRIAFMAVPGARFEDERRKTWKRIKANAQAIAALPDLIEALKGLSQYEGHHVYCGHAPDYIKPCVCGFNEAQENARSALTKAGGPQ